MLDDGEVPDPGGDHDCRGPHESRVRGNGDGVTVNEVAEADLVRAATVGDRLRDIGFRDDR